MNNGITKYKGVHILNIPSVKYPNMVQVIKTSKKTNVFLSRKFVDLRHACTIIDTMDTERLIEKSRIKATKELSQWIVPIDEDS